MSVRKLSQHFDSLGKVPVRIEDVIAKIGDMVPDDKITVHGIDIDPSIVRGACYSSRVPPMKDSALTSTIHHVIAYSTQLSVPEQRLVVCKELIHILDPDPMRTASQERVLKLAEDLLPKQPNAPSPPIGNNIEMFVDKMAIWLAVIVLFPYGYWEATLQNEKDKKFTTKQIAEALQLPESYIYVTQSAQWETMRELFLQYC